MPNNTHGEEIGSASGCKNHLDASRWAPEISDNLTRTISSHRHGITLQQQRCAHIVLSVNGVHARHNFMMFIDMVGVLQLKYILTSDLSVYERRPNRPNP